MEKIIVVTISLMVMFIIWIIVSLHLLHNVNKQNAIRAERLRIYDTIVRGHRADHGVWSYHNVAYINKGFSITIKEEFCDIVKPNKLEIFNIRKEFNKNGEEIKGD